jgi:hypothetical protein
MFKIDPLDFWTIKHLTCGATFQIKSKKIIDGTQPILCSNCGIPLPCTGLLRIALDKFDMALREIEQATKTTNEPYEKLWEINPPIKIIEEDEPT